MPNKIKKEDTLGDAFTKFLEDNGAKVIDCTVKKEVSKRKIKKDKIKKETYTEFVAKGGEIFPEDMYPVRKTSFTKVKYKQV